MKWKYRSFEILPALRFRGRPLRGALRTVTVAWMFGVVWMSCISGSQMTLFCRLLGFQQYHFGILAAIPFAATYAQLIAAAIIERTGLRKYMFIVNACIQRLLWVAIAATPLLLGRGHAAIAIFMALYGLAAVLAHLSSPPWTSWMSDLIPRRIRGRYFANRSLWTIPIQIVVVFSAGIVLDLATTKNAPLEIARQPLLLGTICGLFVVGAVFGVTDILLFLRIREIATPALLSGPEGQGEPKAGLVTALLEPIRVVARSYGDRVFRNYALYGAVIAFSMTVSDQYFWLNALEEVGYSKLGTNLVFMVCGAVSYLLVARMWGRLIDRWGRRPILILATAGTVLSPLGWFFIPAANLPLAYLIGVISCLIGGMTWGAVSLGQVGIVMGFSETKGRSYYIAAAAVVAAVGGVFGGLAGGGIAYALRGLQDSPLHLGPFHWNNYHATFLASMLLRGGAILFLVGMPDPGARPLREMMRQVRFDAYSNVMTRLFWPLRAVGQRRGQRAAERGAQDEPRGDTQ